MSVFIKHGFCPGGMYINKFYIVQITPHKDDEHPNHPYAIFINTVNELYKFYYQTEIKRDEDLKRIINEIEDI